MDDAADIEGRLGRNHLFLVVGIAFFVRFIYMAGYMGSIFLRVPMLDQLYYHQFAVALAEGGDLTPFGGFRPVLYPAFLAVWYKIAGPASGMVLARFVQTGLGLVTAVLVAQLGGRLMRDARAGVAAGLIYALAGPVLYFEWELQIESFFAFLMTVVLWMMARGVRVEEQRPALWWSLAGVGIGLATQARPNALAMLPVVVVYMAVLLLRGHRGGLIALIAVPAMYLVLVPFGFINKAQSGHFQMVTGAGGINLYVGNNRKADGMIPRQGGSVSYAEVYRDSIQVWGDEEYARRMAAKGSLPSTDPSEISQYWQRETLDEIDADPARWLGLMAHKCSYLLWNREIANYLTYSFILKEESTLLKVLPVRWWLLMALAPVGCWGAWKRGDRRLLLIMLASLFFCSLAIVAFFVNGRFRIPLWPAMAILSGGGVLVVYETAKEGNRKRLMQCGAVAVLGAVLALLPRPSVPAEDYSRDYFFRSMAYVEQGMRKPALEDARKAHELDPGNPDIVLNLANAVLASGGTTEAERLYRDYTRMDPNEPRGWNNLGVVLEQQERWSEAYDAYLRAWSLNRSYAQAALFAAMLELRAGLTEEAAAKLETVEPRGGGNVYLQCAMARLRDMQGDPAGRDRYLERARAIAPGMVDGIMAELESPIPRRNLILE